MGLPIGHHVRSQLCLSRDVNYLISLTIRYTSTSAFNDLGCAKPDKTTSSHTSDNSNQCLNCGNSNSVSSGKSIYTRGRDSEQIQILIHGTESEWLVACAELLKVSKEGRGWKLAWFISRLEQQIEHLQGQQHQLTAAIKLQHEQLKPAETHSLHFYVSPPCTVSKKFSPSPLLILADLAEYNAVLEASNRDLKNMAAFFEDNLNNTWKMNNRIRQHVGEEVSRVRKSSTRRFRARMANAPKADQASNRCTSKEMDPLIEVGVAIRNRFLEQCLGFRQNNPVISLGSKAAHYGNPLADALLYHSDLPNKRTDISRYISVYGFSPEKVLGCEIVALLWTSFPGMARSAAGTHLRTSNLVHFPASSQLTSSKSMLEQASPLFKPNSRTVGNQNSSTSSKRNISLRPNETSVFQLANHGQDLELQVYWRNAVDIIR